MAARLPRTGRKSNRGPCRATRLGGEAEGMTTAAMAKAPAAATAPNRKAAAGPALAEMRLATANDVAPAIPTPAACQDTARDCALPSSGSAIAFRPGI